MQPVTLIAIILCLILSMQVVIFGYMLFMDSNGWNCQKQRVNFIQMNPQPTYDDIIREKMPEKEVANI